MGVRAGLARAVEAAAILGTEKSFLRNGVIGDPELNRRGLHRWRVATAARLSEARRRRMADRIAEADRVALDRDGFVIKPDFLDPETFRAVRDAAFGRPHRAHEQRQGETVTRHVALGGPGLAPLRTVARRRDVADLMGYAAGRSGAPAMFLQAVLAEPGRGGADPQTDLHADTFHPTAKLWLFLTDVGEADGPFVFAPGSARLTPERLAWEYEQSLTARDDPRRHHAIGSFRIAPEAIAGLGYRAPRRVTVKANTLVVANTWGFHKRAPSTRPTTRVELYGSLRRNPFVPWNGLDPAALATPYQSDAFFGWLALRRRLLGRRAVWTDVGETPIDGPALS